VQKIKNNTIQTIVYYTHQHVQFV